MAKMMDSASFLANTLPLFDHAYLYPFSFLLSLVSRSKFLFLCVRLSLTKKSLLGYPKSLVFFPDSFFLFAMIPCLVLRDLNFTMMGKLVFVRDFTRWAASISSGVILTSHAAAILMTRSSMFSLALAGNPSISIISRLPYCSKSSMVDSLFRTFLSNTFTVLRSSMFSAFICWFSVNSSSSFAFISS